MAGINSVTLESCQENMLEQHNLDPERNQENYYASILDTSVNTASVYTVANSEGSKELKNVSETEGKTIPNKLIATKYMSSSNKLIAALLITLTVFAIIFFICLTIGLVEIYKLRVSSSQLASQLNASLNGFKTSSQLASQLNTSLNSFKTSLLGDLLGQLASIPANSCSALLPSASSGYYYVKAANGSAVRVYCDMTLDCGNVTGKWMRVAQLDMTDSSQQCPSGLIERVDPNRTCISSSSSEGCSLSILFETSRVIYTRVCGKVIGYQIGHTNAFASSHHRNINSYYVDGVSLTHGSPRQHIWTFAAARDSLNDAQSIDSKCSCISNGTSQPPHFVQNDYFCDTGANTRSINDGVLFDQPLWDSKGCEGSNNCCLFNTPPWFFKQLPQPTIDDIEMRICRDEEQAREDVAIEKVDIYIM